MQRPPSTDRAGKPFSPDVIEAVWRKAREMPGYRTLRLDAWGWTIVRQDYGKTQSRYGWEIDHVLPVEMGGGDELTNLQALHWENNRRKEAVQSNPGLNTVPDAEPLGFC